MLACWLKLLVISVILLDRSSGPEVFCKKYVLNKYCLIILFITAQRVFLSLPPNGGIFYQIQQKILLLSKNSKHSKIILDNLTAVLVEYVSVLPWFHFRSSHRSILLIKVLLEILQNSLKNLWPSLF